MKPSIFEKLGGVSLIAGSILFSAYSSLFVLLLPIGSGTYDYVEVVRNPNWVPLALVAFMGILLMLIGFHAVRSRVRATGGVIGAVGFLFIQGAYLLQACKVTWELFLYPVIAAHPESAFLLRDAVIKQDPSVVLFRTAASITIFIGVVLFCLTLYRSNEYPKAAPLLIFVGALTYALGPLVSIFASVTGIFVLAIGCSLLGIHLFKPSRTHHAT